MINGREFAERFYSETCDYEEEKLYSTGNDEIDELLERAFCEGYEYAQKEFAEKKEDGEKEEKKKNHTGAKIAAATVGGTAATVAGSYGAGKLVQKVGRKIMDKPQSHENPVLGLYYTDKAGHVMTKEAAAKAYDRGTKVARVGLKMQEPGEWVAETGKKAVKAVKNLAKKKAKK